MESSNGVIVCLWWAKGWQHLYLTPTPLFQTLTHTAYSAHHKLRTVTVIHLVASPTSHGCHLVPLSGFRGPIDTTATHGAPVPPCA